MAMDPAMGMLLMRYAMEQPEAVAELAATAGIEPPATGEPMDLLGETGDLNALLEPMPQSPLAGISPPPMPDAPPVPATPPPPRPSQAIQPAATLIELLLRSQQQAGEGSQVPGLAGLLLGGGR